MILKALILDDITKGGSTSEEVMYKVCTLGYPHVYRRERSKETEKDPLVRQKKNQGREMSWKPSRERISRGSKRSTRSNTIDRLNRMSSDN